MKTDTRPIENTAESCNKSKPLLYGVNGGRELIGRNIEMWINGKYGRFFRKGTIIDFYKNKGKGKHGSLTIMKGQYLIDFGNGKKYWKLRSDFNLI